MIKIQIVLHLVKTNGIYWLFLYLLERVTVKFTSFFYKKRIRYETKYGISGFNSVLYNYREWSNYDWSEGGEEWTNSQEWKKSLIKEVIDVYIKPGGVVLEIGPGAGRWSKLLVTRAERLILVDLTEKSIELCKAVLKGYPNCEFYKNDGGSMPFIKKSSVDYLWSFDVFVHIAPAQIEQYIKECNRIFRKGAVGLIHHSTNGTNSTGFRSSLTNDLFLSMLKKNDLKVLEQIDHWGSQSHFKLSPNDIITIFYKEK